MCALNAALALLNGTRGRMQGSHSHAPDPLRKRRPLKFHPFGGTPKALRNWLQNKNTRLSRGQWSTKLSGILFYRMWIVYVCVCL